MNKEQVVKVSEKHIVLDGAINRVHETADRLNNLLAKICGTENCAVEETEKQPEPSLSDVLESGQVRLHAYCDGLERTIEELKAILFNG